MENKKKWKKKSLQYEKITEHRLIRRKKKKQPINVVPNWNNAARDIYRTQTYTMYNDQWKKKTNNFKQINIDAGHGCGRWKSDAINFYTIM